MKNTNKNTQSQTNQHNNRPNSNHKFKSYVSKRTKGSITIEAAFALPLFLYATLCLVLLLEIHIIQNRMQQAITYATTNAVHDYAIIETPVFNFLKLKADIVDHMGSDRIDRSMILNGTSGISTILSRKTDKNDEIYAQANYKIRLPVPLFQHVGLSQKVTAHMKAWTGLDIDNLEDKDFDIVYITDTGTVYHENYHCTHLQLSISYLPLSDLHNVRNDEGGKYYACEKCKKTNSFAGVYITSYGNRYHSTINCSGLKRTIKAVPRSQVIGRGGCSRCS